jgi:4-amino-4-deoxychorismate lyase
MSERSLVNGKRSTQVALADRGFAYGDGVFETVLVASGAPVWWDAHVARLERGCGALGIAFPGAERLARESEYLIAGDARAVLKIAVTRGISARGYATPVAVEPTRAMSLHAGVMLDPADYLHGVALRWCEMRLAVQPLLAGIKHLNRLEQVLARNEWSDASISEGLVCDTVGRVVSAVAANLFIVRGGRLITPSLKRCGVAGICREWVLERAAVAVEDLTVEAIESADELFLTSSLRGILPVARLDGRRWTVGPMTRQLQHLLWEEVPALQPAQDSRR